MCFEKTLQHKYCYSSHDGIFLCHPARKWSDAQKY
jgi:hypothetical protein